MALTGAQQTKMTELKVIMADFGTTFSNSPTMQSMFGSYTFDLIAKLNKKIAELEQA